jgi:hypothetical protein
MSIVSLAESVIVFLSRPVERNNPLVEKPFLTSGFGAAMSRGIALDPRREVPQM